MKILLLGEYSKLHNSLRYGLQKQGHQADLAGTGDGFKNFPVDFSYAPKWTTQHKFFTFLRRGIYKVFKIDLRQTERGIRFYFLLKTLKNYDYIQLINSDVIKTHPQWSIYLLKRLFKQNGPFSLLICGDETPVTDFLLNRELKYSVLTPYFENENLEDYFYYVLKYAKPKYRKLFNFVAKNSDVLITSDIDYQLAMNKMDYTNQFIPNPIIVNEVPNPPKIAGEKIHIFLGINRLSYLKKGIPFFEKALEIIQQKYRGKIIVQIVENLPYQDYVKAYEKAHIFLDMVYAYDQGYNALEAMLAGKVVFTGAESEFLKHYTLSENEVCINALPDIAYLVKKLSWLIENPSKIECISKNAQAFILKHHNAETIAQQYLKVWEKNNY